MTNVMTQRVTQLMTKMVSHWLTKHDSPGHMMTTSHVTIVVM